MIEFHALGAVGATDDGVEVNLGGPRQRRLLAMLLIHRGAVVSTDRLAEAVFAGAPTPGAAPTLRSYVARLRRALGDGPTVVTQAPGYLLEVPVENFDVARFEVAVTDTTSLLGRADAVGAAERARVALGSWRGDAYAEFADEDWARPEAQRLTELRLVAHERLVDATLACGRAAEAIPTLESLIADHPYREGFRSQLALALYRTGRQAEALRSLHAFRELLLDELGLDPSPALARLEQQVLEHDDALLAGVPSGQPLRGYLLGERLGTRRDGTVHAARQPGVDRDLVVEIIRSEVADDPAFVRSFDSTVHRLASLQHPAIVPIHDHWREPGAAYLVMRRMHGGTLAARLERGHLPAPKVAELVERVGAAITAAADVGIPHGRLSPSAVLFDGDGTPYVSDFPLAGGDEPPTTHADAVALGRLASTCLAEPPAGLAELVDAASVNGTTVAEQAERIVRALSATPVIDRTLHNPFKGLRAFDETDAADFFGRDRLLDDLVAHLCSPGPDRRLVLLVGGSGTGKSSAVRAGLLPRIRAGAVPGSDEWFVTTVLPDAHPWDALADGLRQVAVHENADLAADLADGVEGIDRVIRRLLPDGGQLLLVVDQFEELFTLASDDEQRAFIDGLVHAMSVPDSRLRVVATLRADFFDRPLASPVLGPLVSTATVTIPAMPAADLEAAIVEPIERVGGAVERALVAELVGAVADEPAALPSLQFALYELAERSPSKHLTLADLRSMGGVSGAIAARAEALFRSLDHGEQAAVRHLFQRLVVINDEGEPSRRRVTRAELAGLAGPADGPAIDAAVDRWAAARLLTLDRHHQSRLPTVELVHEAMLREWPRLKTWIAEDRDAIAVLGELRQAAASWVELDRDTGALYRGARLEVALELVGSRNPGISVDERAFLDASREARDGERREAEEQLARQGRANRRLRAQLGVIAVALVIALVGGFVALDQRRDADRERGTATARELAAAAVANLEADPELSTLLALAAVEESQDAGGTALPEAESALHRAVTSTRALVSAPGVGGDVDWTSDGTVFVTEGPEESGLVELRDATTGEPIRSWPGHEPDVNEVEFGAGGTLLATTGDDAALRVWEVATGDLVFEAVHPELGNVVWAPSFSADGTLVAAGWLGEGVAVVFDVATGQEVSRVVDAGVTSASFSPDGSRVAMADSYGGPPLVAEVATGAVVLDLLSDAYVGDVAWSPDGRWIAASGGDGLVRFFDADTGELAFTASGHEGEGEDVDWSDDSSRLASVAGDGTVRIWDVDEHGAMPALVLASDGTRGGLMGVALSGDGERVLAGDSGVTMATIWDISDAGGAEAASVAVGWSWDSAEFTPDGQAVRLRLPDGIGLVDAATGEPVAELIPIASEADAVQVIPSPDSELLAVRGDGGDGEVRDASSGDVLWTFGDPIGTVLDIAWSGDGAHLVASLLTPVGADWDRAEAVVFDRSGEEVASRVSEPGWLFPSVTSSGDGRLVAMTRQGMERNDPDEMDIDVWDWAADEIVTTLDSETPLQYAQFAPTGELLVARGWLRGAVEVWDAATGERQAVFAAPPIVSSETFSPDGELVATGHRDGTVRIWDAGTGVERLVLEGHDRVVNAVAFSPDGSRLVSVGDDDVARVWLLDLDDLVDLAHERLTRGFTDDECRQYLHVDRCER